MAVRLLQCSRSTLLPKAVRLLSSHSPKTGAIVGVRDGEGPETLTAAAAEINEASSGNLLQLLQYGGPLSVGRARVLYGVSPQHPVVCMVGLGASDAPVELPLERRDEAREVVRGAVAAGYTSLCTSTDVTVVAVDGCGDPEAAAEGAHLAAFKYQNLKTDKKQRPAVESLGPPQKGWTRGVTFATGQNLARTLMETPANILTPTQFAQEAVSHLEPLGVEVLVRGLEWAAQRGMNAFLSVSRGSVQPPVFLEMTYKGAQLGDKHLAIVGKGVTFDTGGISLKPPKGMEDMRADMGGAACTLGALYTIAALKMPLNVKAYIPLCENMPGGAATKPGDVVTASNGKTIQIDNTDAEGRLILADALVYASQAQPLAIVDLATLTGAMSVALGAGAAGAFSNSDALWRLLEEAGHATGDRVWRMPLWQVYAKQVTEFGYADVHNIGKADRKAGACTAASFLQQFVTCPHWTHLDIAGVMDNTDEVPYLSKGMSGRPTRTLAHAAALLAGGGRQLD